MKAISTPLIITRVTFSKKNLRFSAITPEVSEEEAVEFTRLLDNNIQALLEPLDYPIDDTITIDKDLHTKTQSQRLRSVLYLLWEQHGKPGRFEDFYYKETDAIIQNLKDKLE